MESLPLTEEEARILLQARRLTPGDPPMPWRRGVVVSAAGVLAADSTQQDAVVVVSVDGFSVTDASSGERLLRDRDFEASYAAFSADGLSFRLPVNGETVPMFGVHGGDGAWQTVDGWRVELIYPWWPRADVVMRTPDASGPGRASGSTSTTRRCCAGNGSIRAGCGAGSLRRGRHLLVAGSAGAELFSR